MPGYNYSGRDFNQNVSRAKKAAEEGPVYITNRGKPSHVLMTFDAYQKLSGKGRCLAEALSMPGAEEIEFDTVHTNISGREVDF